MSNWLDVVKAKIEQLVSTLPESDARVGNLLTEKTPELAKLAEDIETSLAGGFHISQVIPVFGQIIPHVTALIQQVQSLTDGEKLLFVREAVYALYKFIDNGKEGTLNRVHIPWMPNVIEVKIERWVVTSAAEFAFYAVKPYIIPTNTGSSGNA